MDGHLAEGVTPDQVERWVQSATVLHSNGDALDIAVRGDRVVGVRGRAADRVNRGPPRPSRSTTCTRSAGCSAGPAPACSG
ncbi:hypothetical protein OUQ99_01605 [Streptomonospora nanhaiensis]|uniref:Uncharacterized protein n=1 Tax=Streptomonospora nanhaiensis TaxID=1323731 RepID=A0ABY6YNV3_9ACTN|nr:hypothetical protein [Streptomonospora nanhaiensis]WAE73852.1 hypothetical protein OUQ99_01605 [Streptomonospora nanhaiensis]